VQFFFPTREHGIQLSVSLSSRASRTIARKIARYFPANKSVLSTLNWTADECSRLAAQWEQVSDNPQSPAAYYVTRNLSNAYRRVVYEYENPRDVIFRYGRMIDDELMRKRTELGLEGNAS